MTHLKCETKTWPQNMEKWQVAFLVLGTILLKCHLFIACLTSQNSCIKIYFILLWLIIE